MIASFQPIESIKRNGRGIDHVQYDIYKWGEYKLYTIANREYKLKNYTKASQFYIELINQYPESKYLSEETLMRSAFSCYQTGEYYKQAKNVLDYLLRKYPHTKHFLKAKLWRASLHFSKATLKISQRL